MYPHRRPRRNRKSANLRSLVRENQVTVADLIYPVFLLPDKDAKEEIASMPGIFRMGLNVLKNEIAQMVSMGIVSYCIFPVVPEDQKDKMASESYNPLGFYPGAIKSIKNDFPEVVVMTDVAMDPYSTDGHDGIVENGEILNDETLHILGKMALAQARAGADIIGPSDMMDGRVRYLRELLDSEGFHHVSIMSYTAKYASAFYGPFRDALDSAPKFGDKKTYQMDPANRREALLEAELDFKEGADIMMVKPAIPYLDVIAGLKEKFNIPIAAYQVSGEYAMIKAAGEKGWIDPQYAMLESLLSIKRAGADLILSYFAREFAKIL